MQDTIIVDVSGHVNYLQSTVPSRFFQLHLELPTSHCQISRVQRPQSYARRRNRKPPLNIVFNH